MIIYPLIIIMAAIGVWAIFDTRRLRQKSNRMMRGLCTKCGQDLEGRRICSECGEPKAQRWSKYDP